MNIKQENMTRISRKQSPRKVSALGVLGIIFLVFCGIGLISAMIASGINKSDSSPQAAAPSALGTSVGDEGFNFVVNSFKCGEKEISTGDVVVSRATAQGQFCRLNITVTNSGDTTNRIRAYDQYLFNAKEQRFEYDAHATSVAAGNYIGAEINDDINPGNSVTADIVFDIPLSDAPSLAELHGSNESQGVRVNLQ